MLTILWHDQESDGYTDIIPIDWLQHEGQTIELTHDVIGPRGARYIARCNLVVQNQKADLDYRPYSEFNIKNGMRIGVLRIMFSNSDRESISQIFWQEKGDRKFNPCSTTVNFTKTSRSDFDDKINSSMLLTSEARKKRLLLAKKIPKKITTTTSDYERNPDVVAEALRSAKGICQSCKEPAPFRRADNGTPFLEVHHKKSLADGGEDTVENAVALCPNCHRKAHYG